MLICIENLFQISYFCPKTGMKCIIERVFLTGSKMLIGIISLAAGNEKNPSLGNRTGDQLLEKLISQMQGVLAGGKLS